MYGLRIIDINRTKQASRRI